MKLRFAALALLALPFSALAESSPGGAPNPTGAAAAATEERQYCRYVGDDHRGKLETVIVTMKNNAGVTVELVGAIHIADSGYYDKLNDLFKGYEELLFELVDGQNLKQQLEWKAEAEGHHSTPKVTPVTPAPESNQPPAAAVAPKAQPRPARVTSTRKSDDVAFTILHGMMTGMGSFLHLTYQTDGVDYSAKNFVHADVSMAEFQRLQVEKGESWLQLFQKSIEAQLLHPRGKDEEPKPSQLLLALLGDSVGIKITMARLLGGLQSQGEDFGFGGDSVIVGERNRVALEVFDREVKAGHKNLGIFYGAMHLQNMEQRLEERGFHRTAERWLTAWDIKPLSDEKKAGKP